MLHSINNIENISSKKYENSNNLLDFVIKCNFDPQKIV